MATMTTVNLSEHHAAALAARAAMEGLSLEAWLQRLAEQEIQSAAPLQKADAQEWARRLDEFFDLPHSKVVLSEEAMRRESIYPDHG